MKYNTQWSSLNTAGSDNAAMKAFSQMFDDPAAVNKSTVRFKRRSLVARRSTMAGPNVFKTEEDHNIADDVYNIFFFSEIGGRGFFFTVWLFTLKMVLYSLLLVDTMRNFMALEQVPIDVRITQFLMLPICIAMQEDLMAAFFTIFNIHYCPSILLISPHATKTKFFIANILRGIDGLYTLSVNFAVLLIADGVPFLSFFTLQPLSLCNILTTWLWIWQRVDI